MYLPSEHSFTCCSVGEELRIFTSSRPRDWSAGTANVSAALYGVTMYCRSLPYLSRSELICCVIFGVVVTRNPALIDSRIWQSGHSFRDRKSVGSGERG